MKKLLKQVSKLKELVFLDLEGTQFSHELISLGAVKASLKNDGTIRRLDKGFQVYVKATNRIGSFVEKLTGISEDILTKEGLPYPDAIAKFKKYVGKNFNNTRFVTFGTHDVRIINQSAKYSPAVDIVTVRQITRNNIDLASVISEYVRDENNNAMSLINYCKIFNVKTVGVNHDALFDAKNLALLYDACLKNRQIIHDSYLQLLLRSTNIARPLQKLVRQLKEQNSVGIEDLKKYIKEEVDAKNK